MSDNSGPAGHPMNKIAQQFLAPSEPSAGQPAGKASSSVDQSQPVNTAAADDQPVLSAETTFDILSLSPNQIDAPSFFVDQNLSVVWDAPCGTDPFSQALTRELKSTSTRNVFHLLLRPAIREALSDWQAFFSFVYIMLRRSAPPATFDAQTDFISTDHIPAANAETTRVSDSHPFQVDSCGIGRKDEATEPSLRLFGLKFKTGTLFLLRQDLWHPVMPSNGQKASASDDNEPVDQKKSICVLSARLNDSHRIADTMLPEVFFKFMNRIWDESDGIIKALGGIRAGCNGAQIHYVFNESAGRNPIFSAICGATRMGSQMLALEEKLKVQQGWADEICMNIGISHGTDDLAKSDPAVCMEFTIPGGAYDHASHLSAVAGKGETWITKAAVAQLPKKLIDQVVLGVDRQGRFLRNFFTRLSDLTKGSGAIESKPDLGRLSIARVLRIETHRPDQSATNEV